MERLTKSDLDRIKQFANTPMHERSPEILMPEGEESADRTEQDDSTPSRTARNDSTASRSEQ